MIFSRATTQQYFKQFIASFACMITLAAPAVGWACGAAASVNTTIGPYSPNAIKLSLDSYTNSSGGFSCSSGSILTLLSGNYLSATATSTGNFKLTSASSGDTPTYSLAADAAGSSVFTASVPLYYINGTLINVLGLLGTSTINVPVYIKVSNATAVAAGTYTGQFKVLWHWYFCPGIGALGLCIGTVDSGSATTTINVTLTVQPVSPVVQIATAPTWDPVDKTSNPMAIPGGKQRMTITVSNPDIAPMDTNAIAVVIPTPPNMAPALDGDGTSNPAPFSLTDGSPASGLAFSYVSGSSTTDNVDFSSDGGATWTYAPTAGVAASQAAVTQVRLRPQGAMAAQSSFSITAAYQVN